MVGAGEAGEVGLEDVVVQGEGAGVAGWDAEVRYDGLVGECDECHLFLFFSFSSSSPSFLFLNASVS